MNCLRRGICFEGLEHFLDHVGTDRVIGVQKQHEWRSRQAQSSITGCTGAPAGTGMETDSWVSLGKSVHLFGSIVGGAIVDDDCFPIGSRLRLQGSNRALYRFYGIF